jgi:hypothetical protein
MKPGVPLLVTLVAACGGGSHPAAEPPAYKSLDEALASVVAPDTTWHLGTNADCTNPYLQDMLSDNSGYEAYAATTDVNGDGHPDHLVALVKSDSGKFYWIPGRDDGFDAPRLFATVNWVREGGFVAQDGTIVFGRFYSDVTESWRWSPATQRLDPVHQDSTSES